MHITDIITAPWAIIPEKLTEIQGVYAAHLKGDKIDIDAVEARLGKTLSNDSQGYIVNSGVAVIPISGVIGKRMNMMSQISGGASTQLIERDIKSALNDSSVDSILLHIDSPGGTVDGTQNLAEIVRFAATQKPVIAFADGVMASAAYWIGSAAAEIVSSSNTTQIGSIGVVVSHTDVSKAEANAGVKTTEISAGKYKRLASRYSPLSEEGAALLQDQVDQLYTIFVDAVAENRGVEPDIVLKDMADGRIFLSKDAKKRGMIDHIANLETTISKMSTGVWPMNNKVEQSSAQPVATEITIEELKEKYPSIVSEIMREGAECERARIVGCEEAGLPGHEAIVNAMKSDGKSTGADVALAIVAAEKKLRAKHLQEFTSNAPQVLEFAASPTSESTEDMSKPVEERAKAKWDLDAEVRSEFNNDYQSYLGYCKAIERGKVKVMGNK